MQTTTSNNLGNAFATSPKALSAPLRFTVTASSEYGPCHHDFVDLDCAVNKMRELMVLGIPDLSIKRSTCHTECE